VAGKSSKYLNRWASDAFKTSRGSRPGAFRRKARERAPLPRAGTCAADSGPVRSSPPLPKSKSRTA